jgi:hypothetical protein
MGAEKLCLVQSSINHDIGAPSEICKAAVTERRSS